MGNSITTHFDMTTKDEAHMVISSLCETIGMRLRKNNSCFNVVSINYKTDSFFYRRKQKKLNYSTDSTQDIKKEAIKLFDELWEEEPIRQVGVHVAGLSNNNEFQLSLLENGCNEKKKNLDKTIDNIRNKYGNYSISTAQFLDTPIPPLCGGINEDDYPMMSSLI
ncbi:DNA polymerase IV [bioreactor metagenome]|uniref:DNA polymerase IV n=1 Tax=bioreactor metagenome TaxID=1076179 RepID=A0A645J2X6_9ZZZZ